MTESIRALIVDDETPSRTALRLAMEGIPRWILAGECINCAQARSFLADTPIDVILLDIQMPHETGLALARELSRLASPPIIVFVTAYDAYAVEAFEVHALDYLLKPFDDQRFLQMIQRVESLLAYRQGANYGAALQDCLKDLDAEGEGPAPSPLTRFIVRSTGNIEIIPLSQVEWINSAGNYVELHLPARTVLHRVPIGQLERHLDPNTFLRVHRTAIVRPDQISALHVTGDGTYAIDLRSGAQVPVSLKHVKVVREVLGL